MTLEIKIARNAAILFAATAISGLFFFISQIVMARYLGSSDFGAYSFAFAYAAISSYLIEGGLGTLMIREVSRHKEQAAQYLAGSLQVVGHALHGSGHLYERRISGNVGCAP